MSTRPTKKQGDLMGRKKSPNPKERKATKIDVDVYDGIRILSSYTKEDMVVCLSRLVREALKHEIPLRQAEYEAKIRDKDPKPSP